MDLDQRQGAGHPNSSRHPAVLALRAVPGWVDLLRFW